MTARRNLCIVFLYLTGERSSGREGAWRRQDGVIRFQAANRSEQPEALVNAAKICGAVNPNSVPYQANKAAEVTD
jgi:hypothetical protein